MKEAKFCFKGHSLKQGDKTQLCAILNVTPDSFSDGGKWFGQDKALTHARELITQGADMIDIGGESTRPGSTLLSAKEEMGRILPIIRGIREFSDIPISVDTWKAEVAEAALEAGADIINDITGLMGDAQMAPLLAKSQAGLVLMFNPAIARPDHESAKNFPHFGYGDNPFSPEELANMAEAPILEVCQAYFAKALNRALTAGMRPDQICLDPGIGFALTKRENLQLIQVMDLIHNLGYCIFLGVSRKRFIVNILSEAGVNMDAANEEGFANRDLASSHLTTIAASRGVEIVRVHSLAEHMLAREIGYAIFKPESQASSKLGVYK